MFWSYSCIDIMNVGYIMTQIAIPCGSHHNTRLLSENLSWIFRINVILLITMFSTPSYIFQTLNIGRHQKSEVAIGGCFNSLRWCEVPESSISCVYKPLTLLLPRTTIVDMFLRTHQRHSQHSDNVHIRSFIFIFEASKYLQY